MHKNMTSNFRYRNTKKKNVYNNAKNEKIMHIFIDLLRLSGLKTFSIEL